MTPWDTELGVQSSHATPHPPIAQLKTSPMRPAFGSIFWPVFWAIIASMIVVTVLAAGLFAVAASHIDNDLNSSTSQGIYG